MADVPSIDTLKVDTIGAVRLLTLNRSDKLNAMDTALIDALIAALRSADADAAVGAIVLAGAGRAFSAGADIAEFKDLPPEQRHRVEHRGALTASLQLFWPGLSRPVIAATQGHVLGGGCALALACDMVVAAESSRFGYPEVKRGILASSVTPNLARQVGTKAAFELLVRKSPADASGRAIPGTETATTLGFPSLASVSKAFRQTAGEKADLPFMAATLARELRRAKTAWAAARPTLPRPACSLTAAFAPPVFLPLRAVVLRRNDVFAP
jgi:enoyl-CoA hydratase/carnithine racemase